MTLAKVTAKKDPPESTRTQIIEIIGPRHPSRYIAFQKAACNSLFVGCVFYITVLQQSSPRHRYPLVGLILDPTVAMAG